MVRNAMRLALSKADFSLFSLSNGGERCLKVKDNSRAGPRVAEGKPVSVPFFAVMARVQLHQLSMNVVWICEWRLCVQES
jgi:hypothetical protein